MKRLVASFVTGLSIIAIPAIASAHVVVTPKQVGVAAWQTFNVSVPNEKEVAVTGLRVAIPAGVESVTPTVKPGWTITTQKSGDSITEISWTEGTIPAGQRDDFSFSAQAPGKTGDITWKAYQSYADGTIVSWDQAGEKHDDDSGTVGPASQTTVVDDVTASNSMDMHHSSSTSSSVTGPYVIAGLAVVISLITLLRRKR